MRKTGRLTLLLSLALALLLIGGAAASAGFTLPENVTEIGDEAFLNVPIKGNLDVPWGVTAIGARAFAGCGLDQVFLPATVQYIAPNAFDDTVGVHASPGTYARDWCAQNGIEFGDIRPGIRTDRSDVYPGEAATVYACYEYPGEVTAVRWEEWTSPNIWTTLDETDSTLTIPWQEGAASRKVRCRVCTGGEWSLPGDDVTVSFLSEKLAFDLNDESGCRALSGDSVYLSWSWMGENTRFTVYQWIPDETQENGGEWTAITETQNSSCTLYGLAKNTNYSFVVVGVSEDGTHRAETEAVNLTTLADGTFVYIRELGANGCCGFLVWDELNDAQYDVFMGRTEDSMTPLVEDWSGNNVYVYDLVPGATYYLQVRATIPGTDLEFWSYLQELTIGDDAEGPYLYADPAWIRGDSVTLSWSPLTATSYDVYMTPAGEEERLLASSLRDNYYDAGGLTPGASYSFRAVARCGSWSTEAVWKDVIIPARNPVEYRALLIGEVSFGGSQYAARNYGDVERLAKVLETAQPEEGAYYSVLRRKDLSRDQIFAAIQEAFGNADENDVSLFMIATHGDTESVGPDAGCLITVDSAGKEDTIQLSEPADALGSVPGTVIVWLGSCGSGAAIYDADVPENSSDAFNAEVVRAFASYSPAASVGGESDEASYVTDDGELHITASDLATYDLGEFRQSKFYVLTAARYRYVSYGFESEQEPYNFFPLYLCNGLGTDMAADLDRDGSVTQQELFTYIKRCEEDTKTGCDQDVQVYPLNSGYVLFVQ